MDTPYTADFGVLAELVTTPNHLFGAKLHIATGMPAGGPREVLGDFTEATFAGSTAKSVTWSAPFFGGSGPPEVDSQLCVFISTDATIETILGWYLTSSDGTVLLASGNFDTPVTIAKAGDGFSVAIAYRRYDGISVVE